MRFLYHIAMLATVFMSAQASSLTSSKVITVSLNLGEALSPIDIPAGLTIVEPIVNGTIFGSFNGTILGGFAYADVINNKTLQIPTINLYGKTDDGQSFLVKETGIGTPKGQITYIELTIGGRYANLSNAFYVGKITPYTGTAKVAVDVYEIA